MLGMPEDITHGSATILHFALTSSLLTRRKGDAIGEHKTTHLCFFVCVIQLVIE